MYNGRKQWRAFRDELLALPDKHESHPYHPDDETTAVVTRNGESYTLRITSAAQRAGAPPEVYFDDVETYDSVFGVIGATGVL